MNLGYLSGGRFGRFGRFGATLSTASLGPTPGTASMTTQVVNTVQPMPIAVTGKPGIAVVPDPINVVSPMPAQPGNLVGTGGSTGLIGTPQPQPGNLVSAQSANYAVSDVSLALRDMADTVRTLVSSGDATKAELLAIRAWMTDASKKLAAPSSDPQIAAQLAEVASALAAQKQIVAAQGAAIDELVRGIVSTFRRR